MTYGAVQFSTYRACSRACSQANLGGTTAAFVSGATAGAVATTATYPLDLLRTRYAAHGSGTVYRGLAKSITLIAREEGPRGFFQGLGAGVVQVVPYMGLFFAAYEGLRPVVADLQLPIGSGDAVSGMTASALAKSGVFPLDVVRKRLQVRGVAQRQLAGGALPDYGRSIWGTASAIVANEGWRGLYKGLGISVVKATPASAITMWGYEAALGMLIDAQLLE